MDLNILIMAAGLGTRMKSRKAKVLHTLAGQPLITHVYQTALELEPHRIVTIVGHQADQVKQTLSVRHDMLASKARARLKIVPPVPEFVLQAEQRGTGHAVMMARPSLSTDPAPILLLSGDVPQIKGTTLRSLYNLHRERGAAATVLTTRI